jgi:hypothetical protein
MREGKGKKEATGNKRGKEVAGKNWPEIIGGKELAVTLAGGSLFMRKNICSCVKH